MRAAIRDQRIAKKIAESGPRRKLNWDLIGRPVNMYRSRSSGSMCPWPGKEVAHARRHSYNQ